jgi:hypothetical protein
MKFFRSDLYQHSDDKNDAKDSCPNKVARALRLGGRFTQPRHGYGVACGFTERRRQDLNDPKHERDLRNFTNNVVKV